MRWMIPFHENKKESGYRRVRRQAKAPKAAIMINGPAEGSGIKAAAKSWELWSNWSS